MLQDEIGINPSVWDKSLNKVLQQILQPELHRFPGHAANPATWNYISSLDLHQIPQNVRAAAPWKGNSDNPQRRLKQIPPEAANPGEGGGARPGQEWLQNPKSRDIAGAKRTWE